MILFFFNDTATTEIYTLSLHDALPISLRSRRYSHRRGYRPRLGINVLDCGLSLAGFQRSEEQTSELQSHLNLVCRLLLEKKKHDTRHGRDVYLLKYFLLVLELALKPLF